MLRNLFQDQSGLVVSAELVLVLTITVLAMVVGLHAVAKSVAMELNDLAGAFGTIDQTFTFNGLVKTGGGASVNAFNDGLSAHAAVRGAGFRDGLDRCDCTPIIQPRPPVKADTFGFGREAGFFGFGF